MSLQQQQLLQQQLQQQRSQQEGHDQQQGSHTQQQILGGRARRWGQGSEPVMLDKGPARAGADWVHKWTVPEEAADVYRAIVSRPVGSLRNSDKGEERDGGRTGVHGSDKDVMGATRAPRGAQEKGASVHQRQPEGEFAGGQRTVVSSGGERVGRITQSLFAPLPFRREKTSVHIT